MFVNDILYCYEIDSKPTTILMKIQTCLWISEISIVNRNPKV
jgi:hypothetical protein